MKYEPFDLYLVAVFLCIALCWQSYSMMLTTVLTTAMTMLVVTLKTKISTSNIKSMQLVYRLE